MMVIDALKRNLDPFRSVSIAPLISFRLIFGALMLFGVSRFMLNGWVESLYIEPKTFFPYLGFEWVTPLPGNWMYLPFILMLISSIGIIMGLFYRVSALLFFVSFTYVELLDKSNYLNHYYFVSLVAFLMVLVPANRHFSLDARLNLVQRSSHTAAWHIGIIQFQLAVVYFFAGVAKLNSDWLLRAEPLKTWLQAHHNIPLIGQYMDESWLAYAFSWTGCIYDLTIAFFLLWSRSRPLAYIAVIFFHVVTWYLFPIGVFPWVMIFSTLIFFSPVTHEKLLRKLGATFHRMGESFPRQTVRSVRYFLILYVTAQLLIPFRYLLYPGDLFWNEEGFRFSWRVMLMHKEGLASFYVRDPQTGRESEIDNRKFLTETQIDQMATQPDMILQYAGYLYSEFKNKPLQYGDSSFQIQDPEIRAEIYVSLNGRPSQLFVSKESDLSKLKYDLRHRNWLEPFEP